jgi:hypothetical protein
VGNNIKEFERPIILKRRLYLHPAALLRSFLKTSAGKSVGDERIHENVGKPTNTSFFC